MKRAATVGHIDAGINGRSLRPEVSDELLQEITRRIVAHFPAERINLFGSYVWGTPHADSDLDLLVIMPSGERMARRMARVTEVAHPGCMPMDLLVYIPEEIEGRVALGDPFILEILRSGRTLYQRGSG